MPDITGKITSQYWFCGVCKGVEECTQYTTMIYHRHDTSLVILQPLSEQVYRELKTKVTTVKKVRKRDSVRAVKDMKVEVDKLIAESKHITDTKHEALRQYLHDMQNAPGLASCTCVHTAHPNEPDRITTDPQCLVHGNGGTHR